METKNYTSHYCNSVLHAPAGSDAGYSCPEAGVYNFRATVPFFGDSLDWYRNLYGFNIGLNMKISDAETGDDYALCYAEIKVTKASLDYGSNLSTGWGAFLSGAGLAGLAAGYLYRRRRVAIMSQSDDMNTNFELVDDPFVHV